MSKKTYKFYDLKAKAKVEADVLSKEKYGTDERPRYALKGRTADGRPLSTFVSKEVYDQF